MHESVPETLHESMHESVPETVLEIAQIDKNQSAFKGERERLRATQSPLSGELRTSNEAEG